MNMYISVHVHINIYLHIYLCTHTCICIHICVFVRVYVQGHGRHLTIPDVSSNDAADKLSGLILWHSKS